MSILKPPEKMPKRQTIAEDLKAIYPVRKRFNPSRGGHAPGDLREAFCDYLNCDGDKAVVIIDDQKKPIKWLVGKLWNCNDVLPSEYCRMLDLSQGSTYAMAVRSLS